MLRPRIIPVLLLRRGGLVKTRRFRDSTYVGDPRNAVRIFNEKEVDELAVLDIDATNDGREPDYDLLREIVSEAFMPVAYGGGINCVAHAQRLMAVGVEKVILNTAAVEQPNVVTEIAQVAGSQSVTVCIDVKRKLFGGSELCTRNGRKRNGCDPVEFATRMESAGAGELILQSVDRDGELCGYDLDLLRHVAFNVRVPIIMLGGASGLDDLRRAIAEGASGAAAGSLFVFHGRHRAVLISYPRPDELDRLWSTAGGGSSI